MQERMWYDLLEDVTAMLKEQDWCEDHFDINPNWFKGYVIKYGGENVIEQFFETVEDADSYLQHINTLLVSAGSNPIKDYTVEYEDCSDEITPELIKELRM